MSVIFVVLPLAVLFSVLAVCVFFWAVSHGQFDDLTTPAVRALQDDMTPTRDRRTADPSRKQAPRRG